MPMLAHPYSLPAPDVLAELRSDPKVGLSAKEAAARLQREGPNELQSAAAVPAWRRFVAQFKDVLVILLLVATVISAALWVHERDAALPYEAIVIFAVVLLNAILGY